MLFIYTPEEISPNEGEGETANKLFPFATKHISLDFHHPLPSLFYPLQTPSESALFYFSKRRGLKMAAWIWYQLPRVEAIMWILSMISRIIMMATRIPQWFSLIRKGLEVPYVHAFFCIGSLSPLFMYIWSTLWTMYRTKGDDFTGVPKRFHYTASRGIISSDPCHQRKGDQILNFKPPGMNASDPVVHSHWINGNPPEPSVCRCIGAEKWFLLFQNWVCFLRN